MRYDANDDSFRKLERARFVRIDMIHTNALLSFPQLSVVIPCDRYLILIFLNN